MTLYTILRIDGDKVDIYYPHHSFTLDNWTSLPKVYVWNTALIAIALHVANVERERERLIAIGGTKPPRKIVIQANKREGNKVTSWIVDETQYAYAGVI